MKVDSSHPIVEYFSKNLPPLEEITNPQELENLFLNTNQLGNVARESCNLDLLGAIPQIFSHLVQSILCPCKFSHPSDIKTKNIQIKISLLSLRALNNLLVEHTENKRLLEMIDLGPLLEYLFSSPEEIFPILKNDEDTISQFHLYSTAFAGNLIFESPHFQRLIVSTCPSFLSTFFFYLTFQHGSGSGSGSLALIQHVFKFLSLFIEEPENFKYFLDRDGLCQVIDCFLQHHHCEDVLDFFSSLIKTYSAEVISAFTTNPRVSDVIQELFNIIHYPMTKDIDTLSEQEHSSLSEHSYTLLAALLKNPDFFSLCEPVYRQRLRELLPTLTGSLSISKPDLFFAGLLSHFFDPTVTELCSMMDSLLVAPDQMLQMEATKVLFETAVDDKRCKAIFEYNHASLVAHVLHMLDGTSPNQHLVHIAISTIRNLAVSLSRRQDLLDLGSFPQLIEFLRTSNNPLMLFAAIETLKMLISFTPSSRSQFLALKGYTALYPIARGEQDEQRDANFELIPKEQRDPRVQYEASRLLCKLFVSPDSNSKEDDFESFSTNFILHEHLTSLFFSLLNSNFLLLRQEALDTLLAIQSRFSSSPLEMEMYTSLLQGEWARGLCTVLRDLELKPKALQFINNLVKYNENKNLLKSNKQLLSLLKDTITF